MMLGETLEEVAVKIQRMSGFRVHIPVSNYDALHEQKVRNLEGSISIRCMTGDDGAWHTWPVS